MLVVSDELELEIWSWSRCHPKDRQDDTLSHRSCESEIKLSSTANPCFKVLPLPAFIPIRLFPWLSVWPSNRLFTLSQCQLPCGLNSN